MSKNRHLVNKRNEKINKRYEALRVAHRQWRHDAIVEKLSEEFFLRPKTIDDILNGRGVKV